MKNTDWISAFVTLIATGIGYFISGPKAAAACIIIGTLGALILHFASKGKADKGEAGKATVDVKDSFNPTFTQTGPTIQVGYPAPPPPPPPVTPPVPEEPKSNIIFLGPMVRIAELRMSGYEGLAFYEIAEESADKGLVACFRNEAVYGKPGKEAIGVRAHLRFFDKNRQEIGVGVSGALWIGTKGDTINLGVDDSGCVLIMHISREYAAVVRWKERKSVDIASYAIHERDMPAPQMAETVQVRLTAGREPLLPPVTIDLRTLKQLS